MQRGSVREANLAPVLHRAEVWWAIVSSFYLILPVPTIICAKELVSCEHHPFAGQAWLHLSINLKIHRQDSLITRASQYPAQHESTSQAAYTTQCINNIHKSTNHGRPNNLTPTNPVINPHRPRKNNALHPPHTTDTIHIAEPHRLLTRPQRLLLVCH
jgi:hypothetical protein